MRDLRKKEAVMKRSFGRNLTGITAGVMALMMLLVLLFSSFFIAAHADHDCTGEDCPICLCIHECENIIRGMGNGTTFLAVAGVTVSAVLILMSSGVFSYTWDTPVSRKVRLDN